MTLCLAIIALIVCFVNVLHRVDDDHRDRRVAHQRHRVDDDRCRTSTTRERARLFGAPAALEPATDVRTRHRNSL